MSLVEYSKVASFVSVGGWGGEAISPRQAEEFYNL